ncbi:FHA domain-containing protein [Myxosarcina sp. GI1]|uniref:FHA domain-containing protein n=1 Tax=Myxosarcina sp. GI1 TaxID=1541065 RepID=UPI00055F6597|nr:FHA domain-containing protein [Myxosarcina sp. GI1]
MITCPNCNHQNPQEALQCENCYSSLPGSASCPNCGAAVQTDATFCGQCGFNLNAVNLVPETEVAETIVTSQTTLKPEEPAAASTSSPMVSPWDEESPAAEYAPESDFVESSNSTEFIDPIDTPAANREASEPEPTIVTSPEERDLETSETAFASSEPNMNGESATETYTNAPVEDSDLETETFAPVAIEPEANASVSEPLSTEESVITFADENEETFSQKKELSSTTDEASSVEADMAIEDIGTSVAASELPDFQKDTSTAASISDSDESFDSATQLQSSNISLLHVQTNTPLLVPPNLDLIHIGKPNNKIPPDIDVSGFAHSEVVSRIHADLRVEGDIYFIEDVGSSNGTYVNHTSLIPGNRHRLRAGDRISLGKEDLVSFIFQID